MRLRNLLARAIVAGVQAYVRYSPLQPGKSRLRSVAVGIINRLAKFDERLLPITISGQTFQLWLVPSSILGALVVFFGNFEVVDVDACLRVLAKRPRPVLLDIGANNGLYSVFAAGSCAHARVVAIEPEPETAARLRRNIAVNAAAIERNGATIEVHELALSAEDGEARFLRSWDDAFGSLVAVFARAKDSIVVPTRRGDALLAELGVGEIDFCKLDVEGGELLVLRGLTRTLRAGKIRLLQVEFNKVLSRRAGHTCEAIVELLHAHDYEMIAESVPKYAGGHWKCENFRFARKTQEKDPASHEGPAHPAAG